MSIFDHPATQSAASAIYEGALAYATEHVNKRARINGPHLRGSMGSAPDLSQASSSTQSKLLDSIQSSSESIDAKRIPASKYRLHKAKYIPSIGNFLGDLFMSTLTSRLNFGFTSNTGNSMSIYNFKHANNPDPLNSGVPGMAPRGNYRGISFMKLRFTDPNVTRDSPNALNASPQILQAQIDTNLVYSCYREFNNCPQLTNGGSASVVQGPTPYIFQASPATTQGTIRQLGLGANLTHFEDHAYQASNFVTSQMTNIVGGKSGAIVSGFATTGYVSNEQGNIGTNGYDGNAAAEWDGNVQDAIGGGILQAVPGTPNTWQYPLAVKDAVMRIQDGYVEFDVTNTAKTPCVIELVLHSMKKCDSSVQSPEVYSEIWNAYDYQVQQQVNTNDKATGANSIGGWQTFYDPDVPLLSLNSKSAKKVNDYAREVHRSNHVLASGQSKVIKVALGGLYYKLGSKSETITGVYTDPGSGDSGKPHFVPSKIDSPGTILVAMGHTGFESMESLIPSGSTAESATHIGTGLWAGKQRSPSSICVSGKYEEKYYPMYIHSTNRIMGNNHPLRPSYINTDNAAGVFLDYGLPTGQLPTTHVTVTEDSDVMRPNGASAVDA